MRQSARRGSPGAASAMRIDGLSAIADRFDAFLIDQFGVIHDGQKLYPGTLGALDGLHRLGKPVVVMTNSGKRAEANRKRLVKMGIPRTHFADTISSGEVAYAQIAGQTSRAFLVGKDGEDYGFDGISFVDNTHDADLLLILGSNVPATSLDQYREMFLGLNIPCLCCNPDKLMLTPDGLMPAPGAIAALYEEMGGTVTWIGKPYPEIYRAAAALAGNPPRILCVGDSPEHDVAGGRAAGFATLLVEQGVSAGRPLTPRDPQPDYVMKDFKW
jgi:HAD superfamily hydrolase (TIGR01459 family)